MANDEVADNLNRVFLWCVPRTVSTAFLKCISFVEGLQVALEPYQCAYHSGPERKNPNPNPNNPVEKRWEELVHDTRLADENVRGFDTKDCTYAWVRDELLEATYAGKKILFCKDMAFYLDAKYHMLPRNFRYSFLIRHPAKVFLSWKNSLIKTLGEPCAQYIDLRKLPERVFPAGYGFREQYELFEYAEKHLDPEPVILDMDDLLADPPGFLSSYCHKMGIPYTPDLLSWESGAAITETWIASKVMVNANKIGGFFDEALRSSAFKSPGPPPTVESLPSDIQACVEVSMQYYNKLHSRRIKPLSTN